MENTEGVWTLCTEAQYINIFKDIKKNKFPIKSIIEYFILG